MLAVGAALGGVVAATLGRDAAFVVDAASFGLSAVLIVGIGRPLQEPRTSTAGVRLDIRGVAGSLGTAISFARGSRLVASLLLSKTTFGVGTGVILMLAVFGHDVFGAGDAGIGILFAARGLGALIGPFLARAVVGTEDRGLLVGIGSSLLVVTVSYALFPLAPVIWLAAVFVFVAHLGGGAQWMLSTYGLQRTTPDEIRGRVFSLDYGLVTLTIAFSTLLAGFLADTLEPRLAVWAMVALIGVAGAGWLWFSRPARTTS
jgi:predicted MFS family arabinose efflux permease